MKKFLQFLHDAMVVRRIILLWALGMSTWISIEMVSFTSDTKVLDVGLAAVLGAVLSPILGLTGYIIKQYATNPYADKLDNKTTNNE